MAKVKEYPIIIIHFIRDIFKGDFGSCFDKLQNFVLYCLDKSLKRDSIIRYAIWKYHHKCNYYEINDSNIKFAIVYFFDKKVNLASFNRFLKQLDHQDFKNYDVFKAHHMIFDDNFQKQYSHVCFLEQDDMIPNHALNNIAHLIQNNPDADVIYTDEDVINRFGITVTPYFKPEYSPLLLLSHNYMNAFLTLKLTNQLVNELKKFDHINQNSIYRLILKMTRGQVKCHRIDEVLYHRHYINVKKLQMTPTRDIVQKEIDIRKLNATIMDYKIPGINRLKFHHQCHPKVSIIIPFKDKLSLLKECIHSLETISTYDHYEIILVNNRSEEKETLDYLEKTKHKVINADIDFNFSRLNNMASEMAKGDYLLLLNNDTKIIKPDWIENMLGLAQVPEIGSVGVKILYPNNKTQHAGITFGVGLINRSLNSDDSGYKNYNDLIRECLCVSGACMMVSKDKYMEVGGLTEELAVEFNDFDFGLKLLKKGYYNIYNPNSVICHYDSMSLRGKFKPARRNENIYMRQKWQDYMRTDPFFSSNFSRKRSDFAINIYSS